MANEKHSEDVQLPIIERGARTGSTFALVLLAVVLICVAVGFAFFEKYISSEAMMLLLACVAMIGVFFIVAVVVGIVQLGAGSSSDDLAKRFINDHFEGTLVSDKKGNIIFANNAYGALTGAENAQDVLPIDVLFIKHREASEAVFRLTNQLREGKNGQEEFRLHRSLNTDDGELSNGGWYRLRAWCMSGKKNSDTQFVWQLSDISDERENQERFFKELQHAINYLDHAPVGFFAAGDQGEVVYLNATLADWLSIDLTAFRPGSVLVKDMIAGDGMALIESVQAESGANKIATLDLDMLKTSGQSMPVRMVHNAITANDGSPGESRTIVLGREINENDDSKAVAAEMRFARFFNNTPMSIASVERAGRIIRTNAPFLKMFSGVVSRDDIENGVGIENTIHEDDRKSLMLALEDARNGLANISPVDVRHPRDEERYFRVYVNAVDEQKDGNNDEVAIIYAVETTDQKALEAQMVQSQKMNAVGTLAGGIAHDFNNVLTAILLSADHLLMSLRPADPSFADLMEIKRNSNRAAVLVRQLLAFSRKQTMRPTVLSLTDLLADLRMLIDRMTGSDVKVEIEYGRDLWFVKTDIGQFEQVLLNLSVNARDAMPDGGKLIIRTKNIDEETAGSFNYRGFQPGEYVMIEIIDEGTGIPADILEKIFEPFFTTKDVGKGTGLGLSMVYGIVKQSGGYIYPDSNPDAGTTFKIFLPRYVEAENTETSNDEGDVLDGGSVVVDSTAGKNETKADADPTDLTGNGVVLLVEDEEAVRRAGKRMLETRGYTVHEAGSGVEALEIINELNGQVDIVVSDVVMPEMDGPTLLRELRKDHEDMKFVFVSGYAEDAFAKNLPENSKFGFLPKPFSLKQLATTVKKTIEESP